MSRRDPELVSASEIASWAWCPESWRLDALGAEPGNRDALRRGARLVLAALLLAAAVFLLTRV